MASQGQILAVKIKCVHKLLQYARLLLQDFLSFISGNTTKNKTGLSHLKVSANMLQRTSGSD